MGALCHLASANGDQNSNTSVATSLTLQVTSTVGAKLNECLPWFDAVCLITTGQSISTDLVLDNETFKKSTKTFGSACAALKA